MNERNLPIPRLELRWELGAADEDTMCIRIWICTYALIMPSYGSKNGLTSTIQFGRTCHAEIDRVVPGANAEDPLPRAMWDAKVLGGLPLYVRVAENAPVRVPLDPHGGTEIKAEIAKIRAKYRNDDAADALARAEWKPGARVWCYDRYVVEITHVVNARFAFAEPGMEPEREIDYYGRRVLKDGKLSDRVTRCSSCKPLSEGTNNG